MGAWPGTQGSVRRRGRSPKALPCAPRRVLLALDFSRDQICVKGSLIPAEVCHRQVQQAPTLLPYPTYSNLKTQRGPPGGPVVKTPAFIVEKTGSIPGLGAKLPQALQHSQKEKKKEKINQVK